jgi:hypothetical protein
MAAPALAALAGCGTVLHPERRGQPAGRIDWAVFALDAVGLIFFFIPGVVAFAVDFATGAIYLPPEPVYYPTVPLADKLRKLQTDNPALTVEEVETIVSRERGRDIRLEPTHCWTQRLERLDDFAATEVRMLERSQTDA